MRRVFTSMDPLLVEQVRSALQHAGIPCDVMRRDLRPLAGQLPFVECWPEVWILDDAQAGAAARLIDELTGDPAPTAPPWQCPGCGETLSARFTSCWKCAGVAESKLERRAARLDRVRARTAYPRLLLWVALAVMATIAYRMLKSQYQPWP